MSKEANVINYYVLCNKLKNVIRTGWKDWNVNRDRLESVAEHIYGTCMLAIALDSEYDFNIDIKKAILMLTIHELEEIYIGDLTPFDNITREDIDNFSQKVFQNPPYYSIVGSKDTLEYNKEYFESLKTRV